MKITYFTKCTKFVFVDKDGMKLDGTDETILERDANQKANGATITGDGANISGKKVGVGPDGKKVINYWGGLRFFIVTGCNKARFVQFKHNTLTITQPGKVARLIEFEKQWKWDGKEGKEYAGSFTKDNTQAMVDGPGIDDPVLGQEAVKKEQMPDGTEIMWTKEYQTFVCCDGKLLGYWSWTVKISGKVASGVDGPYTTSSTKPEWHKPEDSPENRDKVKCDKL